MDTRRQNINKGGTRAVRSEREMADEAVHGEEADERKQESSKKAQLAVAWRPPNVLFPSLEY
jgi:hypothetical protein